jgi:predicted protein tyrosine phosphatase
MHNKIDLTQGNYHRALFVCSCGLHRSATGATVGSKLGMNTRACGTKKGALVPLSANLILWADTIYFVNEKNYYHALRDWSFYSTLDFDIRRKAVIWDIEDVHNYMQPDLVEKLEKLLT